MYEPIDVDFHKWSCRLALHDGYRAAHRIHELWSEQYEDGVESAVKWAEACRVGMMAEARNGGRWGPALECQIAHPYGEEGWRPAFDGHEHWEAF